MKNGWPTKRLADVCEIIMGQSPDGESYNTTGEGVPLINGPVEFSDESFGKTVRSKFTTQPTKFCKEGDLILCVRGSTTGRMNIAGFDACVGRGVAAIRAKQYQPWINHFISSKRDEIHGKGTGATFPNVSGATLADFELVVPPLPEQQRIVGLLDEAFAGIATAKANAERNLKNVRALFESHLQSIFTRRGPGWVDTTLGDVCGFVRGPFGGSLKKSIFVADGYAIYEQQHAIYDQFDDVRYFINEAKFKEMKRFKLLANDLIMSCSGTMGRVAIVPKGIKRGIINQALLKLTPTAKILNTFLKSWMESEAFQDALKEFSGGAAIQNVASVRILKEIKVPLPSVKEQRRVVDELNALREETQRLSRLYERKLAALQALKKSLLHQAFTGQL